MSVISSQEESVFGIRTNSNAIKEYLEILVEYISNKNNFKKSIKNELKGNFQVGKFVGIFEVEKEIKELTKSKNGMKVLKFNSLN